MYCVQQTLSAEQSNAIKGRMGQSSNKLYLCAITRSKQPIHVSRAFIHHTEPSSAAKR